jgi:hypothetical protein
MKSMNVGAQTSRFWVALSITLSVLAPQAFAKGGVDGGGGKGIVCRDEKGKPTVELLDLWEAREIHSKLWNFNQKLDPRTDLSKLTSKQIVSFGVAKLSKAFTIHGDFTGGLEMALNLHSGLFFDPTYVYHQRMHGTELSLTQDSFEKAKPRTCKNGLPAKIEQIVNYDDDGGLSLIDQDLIEAMDALNDAATTLHETFYAALRAVSGEANSLRARRAVGFVLSGGSFKNSNDFLKGKYIACLDRKTGGNETRIYLTYQRSPIGSSYEYVIDRIVKMPIIGQGPNAGIVVDDPQEILDGWKKSDGKFSMPLSMLQSPVDFDTHVTFTTRGNPNEAQGFEAEAELVRSASGLSGRSGPLDCKIESK